jgi:hypothetical protein
MELPKGLLKGMKLRGIGSDPFHSFQLCAVGLHCEHETRANRFIVQQHCASAANAVLAADMGPREPKIIADKIH